MFLVAISLAMDAFAVSLSNGMSIPQFGTRFAMKQGIYFGFFQFIMPMLGWLLGESVNQYIQALDHWIAFLLLGIIGGNMIKESMEKEKECIIKMITNKELILQAIATSIDALAVGVSFALLQVNIYYACSLIGVVAFLFSYIGGILGKKLGKVLGKKAECVGGILLLLIGIHIVLEHIS